MGWIVCALLWLYTLIEHTHVYKYTVMMMYTKCSNKTYNVHEDNNTYLIYALYSEQVYMNSRSCSKHNYLHAKIWTRIEFIFVADHSYTIFYLYSVAFFIKSLLYVVSGMSSARGEHLTECGVKDCQSGITD